MDVVFRKLFILNHFLTKLVVHFITNFIYVFLEYSIKIRTFLGLDCPVIFDPTIIKISCTVLNFIDFYLKRNDNYGR